NLGDEAMWRKQITLSDIHWIDEKPKDGENVEVRLRHRGALHPATINGSTLDLKDAERAVASGQSAVIYRGKEVLGGGIVL
ncbi:MAG: aminomethyltransferase beta-barrel domain-containing protein, partial [Candidatus Saccharimonadales bacterium]